MSQAVVAKQGDWISEAYFAQPLFGLFKDLPGLLTQLFDRLQRYGLALSGTQFQNPESHLGETHLRCTLPGSVIRIFLDRLDISSALEQGSVGHDRRGGDVVEALCAYLPEMRFGTYTSIINLHSMLPGAHPDHALAGLASAAPKSPGPLLVAAATFFYSADADRLSSSLRIEPSLVLQDGLFCQTRVIYDAAKTQVGGLAEASRHYLEHALAELNMALEGLT